jgi:hypothetical protein
VGSLGPFHIILDDAGHHPKLQVAAYNSLWPFVANGGVYVIEDLVGNTRKRFAETPTALKIIQNDMDDIYKLEADVASVISYYNVSFVEKARSV